MVEGRACGRKEKAGLATRQSYQLKLLNEICRNVSLTVQLNSHTAHLDMRFILVSETYFFPWWHRLHQSGIIEAPRGRERRIKMAIEEREVGERRGPLIKGKDV